MQDRAKKNDPLIDQHNKMWYNLQNGISNMDDFFREHGYFAPSDPRREMPHAVGSSPTPQRR
jgi:hypothetical protein